MDIERIVSKGCRRIESLPSTSVMKIQAIERINQKRKKAKFDYVKSYDRFDLYKHKTKRFLWVFLERGCEKTC